MTIIKKILPTSTNASVISISTYLVVIITVLDQLSKRWAESNIMDPLRVVRVTSFLDFNLAGTHDFGVTLFGINLLWPITLMFIALGLVVFFVLSSWRLHTASRMVAIGIGLVMGGIISNTFDLLRLGIAIDFLYFHIGTLGVTLSLADVAIVIGLFLVMLDILIGKRQAKQITP
jgi:signal peptidase II